MLKKERRGCGIRRDRYLRPEDIIDSLGDINPTPIVEYIADDTGGVGEAEISFNTGIGRNKTFGRLDRIKFIENI